MLAATTVKDGWPPLLRRTRYCKHITMHTRAHARVGPRGLGGATSGLVGGTSAHTVIQCGVRISDSAVWGAHQ